jgi:hypothetical protein
MPKSRLARLVEDSAADAVGLTIERHVSMWAAEMAHDLLSDPAFKAEMIRLMRQAFETAIVDLQHRDAPAPDDH